MATDFASLEATIAALPDEKARGDAFERVAAHLLRRDPELGLRHVWGWRDWPGRQEAGAGRDLGIDLVAEDQAGRLVGVQVKFRRDPDRLIRWEDVATAVGYRKGLFNRRLIVTNAWDRGPNAREALGRPDAASSEPVGWLLRDAFLASGIDWTGALGASLSGEAAPERHPRTPRPHQLTAIADTVAVLADQPRAQLVMACGSGKTLTALWISEARDDQRVLVLVPSLLLLRQFRRDWIESARASFADLVVCSDETTVGRDEISVRAADLGVPVTTDPVEIAAFLAGPGRRVIFATYQSSDRIAQAQADRAVPAFDLVVCDEAHKLAGLQSAADPHVRDQKAVLDPDKIRAGRRLFATATPRLYGPAVKARLELEGADAEIASMDDPAVFGPVAHRLSFRSAVEQGILVDYELVVVAVTDTEVADLIDRRAIVAADALSTDAESLAFLVALRTAIRGLDLRRSISFHSSVARARAFARWLPAISDEPPVPVTGHVAGTMPTGERNRVVERLRNPERPSLVTNARCLTEGIDVPALDAVAFVDPRGSHVDVVQAVGRAMRTAPGKTTGRVIIPVFLSAADAADPEAAVESSAFRPVLDVLRALRAHDEELSAEATRLRVELGKRPARLVDSAFLRDHVTVMDVATRIDVASFERALELRTVEVCAVPFEVGLELLRQFAAREGHARVPPKYVEAGLSLGTWVTSRRIDQRHGRLGLTRAAELAAVSGWTWDPRLDNWRLGLSRLRTFVVREGHARVAAKHLEAGYGLGGWIGHQRIERKLGRLDATRIAELESLPGWSWDPFEDDWAAGLDALRTFVARVGHCRVPDNHSEAGFRLGSWVGGQRADHRTGALEGARTAAIEMVPGWTWDPRADDWRAGFQALQAFLAREGDVRVAQGHLEGGLDLGSWVLRQRHAQKAGLMDPSRAAELNELPGWSWEPFGDRWATAMAALKAFVDREGHARVPAKCVEAGFRLGPWVASRRSQRNAGRLDPARAAALDALPGWTWDPLGDEWNIGLDALKAYAAREAHARVPPGHVEGAVGLGSWVMVRRSERRRGKLEASRIAELDAVPGWTWDPWQEGWKAGIAAFRAFVGREGHGRVPTDHVEDGVYLGVWVGRQRTARHSDRLDPARRAELEALPGWTWVGGRKTPSDLAQDRADMSVERVSNDRLDSDD